MTLNCCIVDDEPLAAELLESYIKKTPFLKLEGSYSSAVQAVESVTSGNIDLIFLDIQMPELNGMEFSKIIGDKCRIIFTTAFGQYALDSYKVNALDYLLKPVSYTDFLQSANKALKWFEMTRSSSVLVPHTEEKEFIFVKADYKLVQIPLKDIVYIEGLKDYVKIYVENESHPILSLMSLKSLEETLPTNKSLRSPFIHRTTRKIKVIERNRIIFGKQYIPISDSYKAAFQEFINRHSALMSKL
ncbi:MAG: LytR/AlgR family response regulator transcription factor [Barnesiella sp.]